MAKKYQGKCALCGKEGKLSFEHIPPQAAFNTSPSRVVTGDKLLDDTHRLPWDMDGLRYSNLQQGMGLFSICEDCNNKLVHGMEINIRSWPMVLTMPYLSQPIPKQWRLESGKYTHFA